MIKTPAEAAGEAMVKYGKCYVQKQRPMQNVYYLPVISLFAKHCKPMEAAFGGKRYYGYWRVTGKRVSKICAVLLIVIGLEHTIVREKLRILGQIAKLLSTPKRQKYFKKVKTYEKNGKMITRKVSTPKVEYTEKMESWCEELEALNDEPIETADDLRLDNMLAQVKAEMKEEAEDAFMDKVLAEAEAVSETVSPPVSESIL